MFELGIREIRVLHVNPRFKTTRRFEQKMSKTLFLNPNSAFRDFSDL